MNTEHSSCAPVTFLLWKLYPALVIVLVSAFHSPKYFRIHFFLASKMQYVWQSANTQYGKYANWNRWERVPNEWYSVYVWPNVCLQLNFLFNLICWFFVSLFLSLVFWFFLYRLCFSSIIRALSMLRDRSLFLPCICSRFSFQARSASRSLSPSLLFLLSFSITRTLSTSLPLPHSLHSQFLSSFYFTFQLNLFYMFPFQRALFSHFNGFAFVFMMLTFIVIFKLIQFVNLVLISAWYISHFCTDRIVQTYRMVSACIPIGWYPILHHHMETFFYHMETLERVGTIFYLKLQSFFSLQIIAIANNIL